MNEYYQITKRYISSLVRERVSLLPLHLDFVRPYEFHWLCKGSMSRVINVNHARLRIGTEREKSREKCVMRPRHPFVTIPFA